MLPALSPTPDSGRSLTPKQAAFVQAYVTNGGNREEAAIAAGYSPKTARVQGHQIIQVPHVLAAILELTAKELAASAPRAQVTLTKLLDGKSEYVRLEAANSLLDRIGMKAPDKVDHRVSGDITVQIDLG